MRPAAGPPQEPPLREGFKALQQELGRACGRFYGARLVSVAVYGSVGRGVMKPDSDIDCLIVADPLPKGRVPRVAEFDAVEKEMLDPLASAAKAGIHTRLSPVIKTPAEVRLGSPLFLDMVDDARILFDRDGFLAGELAGLRARLQRLGARRIWRGSAWYWDLKPDYRQGEEFEI